MRYKIMYTQLKASQRYINVMDFQEGQTITFSMDELDKDELPADLKDFIRDNLERIQKGYWDYTL